VWLASHITLAGQQCVGTFPKTILSTCPEEVVLKVSNAQTWCKEETWPSGQVALLAGLTSGPHVPNLRPKHGLTPPINTTLLPPAESVKKVRFRPPHGASKFNLCRVERERRSSKGRRTSWLIKSPRSRSSMEALSESIRVRWSFLSSSSVECGSSTRIL
jgi:hypothetical protein